jgi:hypothetical protein
MGIKEGDVVLGVNGVPVDECCKQVATPMTRIMCWGKEQPIDSDGGADFFAEYLRTRSRPLTLNVLIGHEVATPPPTLGMNEEPPQVKQMVQAIEHKDMRALQHQLAHLTAQLQQLQQMQQQTVAVHQQQTWVAPRQRKSPFASMLPFRCCHGNKWDVLDSIIPANSMNAPEVPGYQPREREPAARRSQLTLTSSRNASASSEVGRGKRGVRATVHHGVAHGDVHIGRQVGRRVYRG